MENPLNSVILNVVEISACKHCFVVFYLNNCYYSIRFCYLVNSVYVSFKILISIEEHNFSWLISMFLFIILIIDTRLLLF